MAVDDETIGFTGASRDHLGVFTVMNEGRASGLSAKILEVVSLTRENT